MAKKVKNIVLARNEKIANEGIEIDGKKLDFHNGSATWVSDDYVAEAIQQKYPKDVAVTQDQQFTWSANNDGGNGTRMDNIHKYTFQGVDMNKLGGNERVKIKTADGYAYVSRAVAEEEGYEIIPKRRRVRRKSAEVQNAKN